MPQKKLFDLRFSLLLFFQVVLVVIGIKILYQSHISSSISNLDQDIYRQVGNQLETTGVIQESIDFYEKQLGIYAPKDQNPELLFRLGELYEQEGLYEKALSRFTMAKFLAANKPIGEECSKKIVGLLERLRKYSAAKRELSNATTLDKNDATNAKGGVVVATIGDNKVYLHDFEKSYDEMVQQGHIKEKDKAAYLQKYIADELMFDKAKKMNLEKDPAIQTNLESIKKQLFIQKIMEKELGDIAKVDMADVENYYKANTDKYKKPFKELEQQVKLDYQQQKAQSAYAQVVQDMLKTEKVQIHWDKLGSK